MTIMISGRCRFADKGDSTKQTSHLVICSLRSRRKLESSSTIEGLNGRDLESAIGMGTVTIHQDGTQDNLKNALHAPQATSNLISPCKLLNDGLACERVFDKWLLKLEFLPRNEPLPRPLNCEFLKFELPN